MEEELQKAAEDGNEELVGFLIESGVSVHGIDDRPLRWAVFNGHLSVVNLLINMGADVNAFNRLDDTALRWAVEKDHYEIVEVLLAAGADVNLNCDIALKTAAKFGRIKIGNRLIAAGADVDVLTVKQQQLLGVECKNYAYYEPGECEVCTYDSDSVTSCGHYICSSCAKSWGKKSCPICRNRYTLNVIFPFSFTNYDP